MVGWTHALALSLVAGVLALGSAAVQADDKPAPKDEKSSPPTGLLDDTPQPFVPLHPRTVEDRNRIEAIEAFTGARSLEDRRKIAEAVKLLEQALKKDPDSLAILRRLSRLCFAVDVERAVEYCRRVINADPNDTAILRTLVKYHEIRNDSDGAEKLLTGLLANPKLDKKSAAFLLAEHDLGILYRNKLRAIDPEDPAYGPLLGKSADAFASLLAALDDKAANELPPADLQRVLGLGAEAAESYRTFGDVLLDAKRFDLAIKAFQRGLVYKPNQPQITMQLTRALIESGKAEEALAHAERLIKQQPQQREVYTLLGQILTALKREDQIIPRLEAAGQADPKNRAVQYALAERYDETGQHDKAKAIYEQLRTHPLSAQDLPDQAKWLLKEKKTDDLLKLLGDALTRRETAMAVGPVLETIANDPAAADELLAAGLKLMKADPPALSKELRRVLARIAYKVPKPEKLAELLRLAVNRDPTPEDYTDLVATLNVLRKSEEVAATIEEMIAKYPNLKNARTLEVLAWNRYFSDKKDAALEAVREARKLEPANPEVLRLLCVVLSSMGKDEEAMDTARTVLKVDASNVDFNGLVGSMLMQAGKNEEAIAHYQALLERFPNNDEIVRLARSGLSAIYVVLEDFAKGEAELEILYKKDPEDAGVNNDLGYLYADQGKNLEQAENMIRKAVAEEPTRAAFLDSLGWVLFKRGKIQEALGPLERAVAQPSGSDPTIQDHLGDVYFRLKEYAKAKTAWEKAAKLAADARPPDKRLPEIRKKLESLKEFDPAPRSSKGDSP
jgi:tetratricopeptide (TPR) repeat protein